MYLLSLRTAKYIETCLVIFVVCLGISLSSAVYSQNSKDTLFIDSTYYNRAVKCKTLKQGDDIFMYSRGIGGVGYLTGTQGSTQLQGVDMTCGQIATFFDYANWGMDSVFLTQISFPRLPNAPNQKLYLATIVDNPDLFQFHIYGGSMGSGPRGKPIYSQSFNLDDLILNNDDIEIPQPVKVPEQFYLSFEVNNKDNNDTLAFYTSNYLKKCGRSEQFTYLLLNDVETFTKSNQWTSLSKLTNPSYDADIIIFPHISLKNKIVSRENTLSSSEIKISPNPAANEVQILLNDDLVNNKYPLNVQIYNLQGRKVKEISEPKDEKLDISDLVNGCYYLTVSYGTIMNNYKLIVLN